MKELVIIGAGYFSKLLYNYLNVSDAHTVRAFSINRDCMVDPEAQYLGLPVVALELLPQFYPPSKFDVIMGIAYAKMGQIREKVFMQCKEMGYNFASYIHPSAIIAGDVRMGEGNIILESTLVQPFVQIGNCNLIWYGVKIAHNDVIGDFNTLAGNTSLSGEVVIGNHCFLGNSCIVRDSVKIMDYTLVGAGAYVAKDSQPYDAILPPRSATLPDKKSTDFVI